MYFPAPTAELSDGCECVTGRVASSVPNDSDCFQVTRQTAICLRVYSWHGSLAEKDNLVKNQYFLIADFLHNGHFAES